MPAGTIRLALETRAIEIKEFTKSPTPKLIGSGETIYALSGTAIDGGVAHEEKYLWEIGTIMTYDQAQALKLLFARYSQLRRGLAAYSLLVYDTISPIAEIAATNTRAIVPTFTTTSDGIGGLSYFAQFRAGFVAPPLIELYATGLYQVDFSLTEHDRVAP